MGKLRPTFDRVYHHLPVLAGCVAPFVLVLALALESGGYDLVPRSQFGLVAWWAVLLGVAAGLLPAIRVTRSGWIVLALMACLVAWTALALIWTQSEERTVIELSRNVTLLGFLLLLLLLQGKEGLRRSLAALGAAAVVVAILALASRFHPSWFDLGVLPDNYPKARLYFPVGYWNGLAALMAMGLAALLWSAAWSREAAWRALSAASIPLIVLVMYMTASRGGAIQGGAALVLLVAIAPGRLRLLVRMIAPALLSVLLVVLVIRRPELRDNLGGPAGSQGTEMIWLTILVFAVGAGIAWLLEKRLLDRVELPSLSRKLTGRIGAAIAGLVVIAFAVGLATGFVGDKWEEFKQPIADRTSATVDRLDTVSSGERYEQWSSAVDAGETRVLTGLGPGAYEYWWSRNAEGPGYVKNAHSLYLEGFAELGIPGLLLTLALALTPIWIAGRAAVRNAADDRRPGFAAAAAGMTAFAVGAGIDWAWEMTVLPAAFFVLVSAVCGPSGETRRGRMNRPDFRLPFLFPAKAGIMAASLLAIFVIAVPMLGEQRILDSQSLYRDGDLSASIEKAEGATDLMPWSANASIQLALLQAEAGDGPAALAAARDATEQDPYSWKAWLVLSRSAEDEGRDALAEEANEKMAELNRYLQDR